MTLFFNVRSMKIYVTKLTAALFKACSAEMIIELNGSNMVTFYSMFKLSTQATAICDK